MNTCQFVAVWLIHSINRRFMSKDTRHTPNTPYILHAMNKYVLRKETYRSSTLRVFNLMVAYFGLRPNGTCAIFQCTFKVIRKFFLKHNKSFKWHLGDYEKHNLFPFEGL